MIPSLLRPVRAVGVPSSRMGALDHPAPHTWGRHGKGKRSLYFPSLVHQLEEQ